MGWVSYEQYIVSKEWYALRKQILSKIGNCVLCNHPASHIHHRTYKSLGSETIFDDVIPLCKTCHMIFHALYKYDSLNHVFNITQTKKQKNKKKKKKSKNKQWSRQRKKAIKAGIARY